jgi:hypothetical protein
MIEKYQQIVKMLLSLTSEGKVEWEKTSANEYKVAIGNNYISILYHEPVSSFLIKYSTPDVASLMLKLWNQNGDLLDTEIVEKPEYGSADYDKLMSLYVAARRSYGNVYDTLDDIISDLDKATKEN